LAASEKCITDSAFFTAFDVYAEFDNAIFKEGKIYKLVQDKSPSVTTYVKVDSVNANDVTLIFSSNTDDYDKVLTFEESDHVSLGVFLKTAMCNKNYNSYFTSISGLDSSTTLGFKWFKETIGIPDDDDADDEPETYDRRYDTLSVNLTYPSFFYFYNGTKSHKYVQDENAEEELLEESKVTITDVTDAEECDNDGTSDANECTTAFFNAVTKNCSISVVETAYALRPYDSKELVIDGDADCTLLKSAGGI
jgi:hypothetical protein